MHTRLPSLTSLPIHTVNFCFPPPTLTTPRNPSLTPNFCAFDAFATMTKILRLNLWKWEPFFVERGYPTHLLDSAIQKAFNNSRRDTLKPPLAKVSDDKIPLVSTFHPFNYKVRDVISRNLQILKNDPETSAIFTDNPLISFRRNKNMRDNLVRSALRENLPASAGTFSCSHARCYTCSLFNSATSISGPKSNFVIRHNFTCTSSNIIYCISCSKCCKLYIGETDRRRLSDRFAEHLRSVRNNDVDKPAARHFNAAKHSISDMKIVPSHSFLVVMIAVKDTKSVSFLKFESFIPTGLMNDFLLFDHIPL